MFFIAYGRTLRRRLYSQKGIPAGIKQKIQKLRELQRTRLTKEFLATPQGSKLHSRTEQLNRQQDALYKRLTKTKTRNRKLERQILVKTVEMLGATLEYAQALHSFFGEQKGAWDSTKMVLQNIIRDTQRQLAQANTDLRAHEAGS